MRALAWFFVLSTVIGALLSYRTRTERNLRVCGWLAWGKTLRIPSTFTGSPLSIDSGRWVFLNPHGRANLWTESFSGRLWVRTFLPLDFGQQVRFRGIFRCHRPAQNPGSIADEIFGGGFWGVGRVGRLKATVIPRSAGLFVKLSNGFRRKLAGFFEGYPGVHGWISAVWTGQAHLLPESLSQFYRNAGLLHLVALSGQHVVILSVLLTFFVRLLLTSARYRPSIGYSRLMRILPLVAAGVLYVTGQGCGSVLRTVVMLLALIFLRFRGLVCSSLQIALSSTALVILFVPERISDIGFLLSAITTAFLLPLLEVHSWRASFQKFLHVSLTMPVLVLPLSAFFFGRISWISPVANVVVTWLWDLILIPLGFLLPLVLFCLPSGWHRPLLGVLEKLWQGLVQWHETLLPWSEKCYFSVIRPTFTELVLLETALLVLFSYRAARHIRGKICRQPA